MYIMSIIARNNKNVVGNLKKCNFAHTLFPINFPKQVPVIDSASWFVNIAEFVREPAIAKQSL